MIQTSSDVNQVKLWCQITSTFPEILNPLPLKHYIAAQDYADDIGMVEQMLPIQLEAFHLGMQGEIISLGGA